MKLIINNKEYEVEVFETDDDKAKGLQDVEEMDWNEGALFVYPEPTLLEFWMEGTTIPLDIIFITSDWIVKSVKQGIPESTEILSEDGVQFALELNAGSGIVAGDLVEIDEPEEWYEELETNSMYIIGEDGKPAYELEGGERIFSRKSTKVIVKKAKRAFLSEKEVDYKALGRYVFNELKAQDSREAEYVQSPEDKKSDD